MEQSCISSVDLLREMFKILELTIKPQGEILLCSYQSRQAVLELRSILKIFKLPFPPYITQWVCPQTLSNEILWKSMKFLRILSQDYYAIEQLLRRLTSFGSILKKFRPIQIVEIGETIGQTFIRRRLPYNQEDGDHKESDCLKDTSKQSLKYQRCRGDVWEHLKLKAMHNQKHFIFDGFDLELNQEVSLDFYFKLQDAERDIAAHFYFQENSIKKQGIRRIFALKYFVLENNEKVFVAVKEQIKENLSDIIAKELIQKSQQQSQQSKTEFHRQSKKIISPKDLLSTIQQLSEVVKSIHNQGYLIKNLSTTSIVYSVSDQCYKLDSFRKTEQIPQKCMQSVAEGVIDYCNDQLQRSINGCLINENSLEDLKANDLYALGRIFEMYIGKINRDQKSYNQNYYNEDEYQESRLLIKTLMSQHSVQLIESLTQKEQYISNINSRDDDDNNITGFIPANHPIDQYPSVYLPHIPVKTEFNSIQVAGALYKIGMVDQAIDMISQIEKDISSLSEENLIELILFYRIYKENDEKAIFYCKWLCGNCKNVIGSEAEFLKLLKQQSQYEQREYQQQEYMQHPVGSAQQLNSGEILVEDSREEIDYDHKSSLHAKSKQLPYDSLKLITNQHPSSTKLLMLKASVCSNTKNYKEAFNLAQEARTNLEFFIGTCFEDLFFDEIVECYLLLGTIELKSNIPSISSVAWYLQTAVRLLKDQEINLWKKKNNNKLIKNDENNLEYQSSQQTQSQPILSKNQRLADACLKLFEVYEIAGDDTRCLFALAEALRAGSFKTADHARILLNISKIFGRLKLFEKQQEYIYGAYKLAEDDKNMKSQSEFKQVLQEAYPSAIEFTNYLAKLAQNY